jgi:hypothetical protein
MSKFFKTDAEFFKADSRFSFVHKFTQDSSVPEPFRQEYIIHYQRICSELVVNSVPVHMLRWDPYEATLETMNNTVAKPLEYPIISPPLLNWLQVDTR